MGTHPIFESDFDCLTDMADLATEIEQMQNAFDDEVDALEQNGGIGHDDEERNGRNSDSDDRRKR